MVHTADGLRPPVTAATSAIDEPLRRGRGITGSTTPRPIRTVRWVTVRNDSPVPSGVEPTSRWQQPAVLCLVPSVMFIVTMLVVPVPAYHSINRVGVLLSTPIYLAFISLPSLAPIAVARTIRGRHLTTAVMSAVAIIAAIAVVRTDDAQAGLAVLFVVYAAIPLAVLIAIDQAVVDYFARRSRPR